MAPATKAEMDELPVRRAEHAKRQSEQQAEPPLSAGLQARLLSLRRSEAGTAPADAITAADGAGAASSADAVAADDPWVLALLGALRVKGLVDRALAEGAVESEESAPTSGEEPALRSLLRG